MTLAIALGTYLAAIGTAGLLYFEYVKHNHHYPSSLKFYQIALGITALLSLIVLILVRLQKRSKGLSK
jgi:hypothetical protein